MGNFAFIDSQNVHLAIKNQGWTLDYGRFRRYLLEKYDVQRAYVFLGYIPEQSRMYHRLESFGYNLVFKPITHLKHGLIKGNVDAELVLQAMIDFDQYDQAVIATGDGDFYCLIHYLKRQEKLQKLLVPDSMRCSKLLKSFDRSQLDYMDRMRDKLEYKKAR